MPELPDLEVFKGNVYKRITSKRLVDVNVYNLQKVTTPEEALNNELGGRELLKIERFGKELLFDFGDRRVIVAHLMLNGKISIIDKADKVEDIKFKIFALNFEEEKVVFSDMGSLCTIKYKPLLGDVPDAFGDDFTLEYFLGIARKKARTNVKAFLIDQKVVKGIGNAYVDEILWQARISPHSKIGKIPDEIKVSLYHAIGTVLKEAVDSIKEIAPEIISGEERSFLKVHTKSREQTETGHHIVIERVASKITYYTEEQVLYQ
jgi:formamidopyrimidine-DNA glycosylase